MASEMTATSIMAQKIGRAVVTGVLVIVGGGVTYAFSHGNPYAVAIYEGFLLLAYGAYFSR
ncbi:MAG: hypothetical protein CSB33_04615 [Desulfobacterales bacterium]|nr:MAG: hypothetical protein CSB33_04615 [Desulfobacterales bacterium]